MKKWYMLVLCSLLLAALSVSAQAAEEFATAEELCWSWGDNYDYPDYICGVYATDGLEEYMTFVLTEDAAGEAGKAEILAQVADQSTVSFAYDKYSYSQLMEVMDGIDAEEAIAAGAMAWGPGKYDPDIQKYMARVTMLIDMSNPAAAGYMEQLTAEFGDKVYFEDGTGMTLESTIGTAPPEIKVPYLDGQVEQVTGRWFWPMVVALIALAVFFLWRAHSMRVCQTADGRNVEACARLTAAQVEAAIRRSNFAPNSDLDRRILEQIDRK